MSHAAFIALIALEQLPVMPTQDGGVIQVSSNFRVMFLIAPEGARDANDEVASRVNGSTLLSKAIQEVGQKVEQSGPNLPGGQRVMTCTPFKMDE